MGRRLTAVACGLVLWGLAALAPAVAVAGSIGGTVTDEADDGISGVYVCATSPDLIGPPGGCDFSDSDGDYVIEGTPASFFVVWFEAPQHLNYVPEFYGDAANRDQAQPIVVASAPVTGIDAELATGGQVTGRVTDTATDLPISGVYVCAENLAPAEVTFCDHTDAEGEYAVHSLATGSYRVAFSVFESPNYVTTFYDGKTSTSEAAAVPVTVGGLTPGIDAEMEEGVQLTGTLTESGSGDPVGSVPACALDRLTGATVSCSWSREDGTFSLAGLPLGSYVVGFAVDHVFEGIVLHPDGYVRRYFDDVPTFAAATAVGGPGPGVVTGIDAELVAGPEVFPDEPPVSEDPGPVLPPVTTPTLPVTIKPQPRPRPCKKGFHKKKVKGKIRCVRNKHRRPRRHPS